MYAITEALIASPSWVLPTALALVLFVAYSIISVTYRLFFSPIARFPGPKIAAATGWYEFYYDVVRPGMYIFEIEKMHAKYGPIVRVNPQELSIHDPDFYDELYVCGNIRKTNKHNEFCQGTGLEGSALLTHDHDLHRRRRRVLDPFFSRFAVRKMESLFALLLLRFEERLKAAKGTVIRLDHAFVAFSGDLIRSVTCEDIDYLMDDKEWSYSWSDLFNMVVMSAPLFTSFPWIIKCVSYIPTGVLTGLFPRGQAFIDFKNIARSHIVQAKQDKEVGLEKLSKNTWGDSVFRKIVNTDLPESELCTDRLTKEAQAIFGAATVAVARTLDTIAFYIIANPRIREQLTRELAVPMAQYPEEFPTFAELEKLPYLQGVVREGLRLSYGSMHRMPRVFPDFALQYKQWSIPPNTPVGMSAYFNHTDPTIFEDPFAFMPDRWLCEDNTRMQKALIPFTRGSRSCLGKNLAMSEITMMTAMLFRPGGPVLELFETDESDVKSVHDFMIPMPKLNTKGLRVLVR